MSEVQLQCHKECEHGECKGKDSNEDNAEFCQFCQKLCLKCDRARTNQMFRRFGP